MTKLEEAKQAVTEIAGHQLCDRGMGGEGICTAWQSKECRCEKVALAVLRSLRIPDDQLTNANMMLVLVRLKRVLTSDAPSPADVGFWFNAVLDAILEEKG